MISILYDLVIPLFNVWFMLILLKEPKSLKKSWFKIVVNYHLVTYNILIGHLVDNSLLKITEKPSLIFSQTCRAISIQHK